MTETPSDKDENKLANFMRKHADTIFMVLRNTVPNLPIRDFVAITRYSDVKEVLDNPGVFRVTYDESMDDSVGPFMLGRDLTEFNDRDKGIMRSVMQRGDFDRIRSTVRQIAEESLAACERDHIDLVPQLTRIVPARFTQEYFGFRTASVPDILRWSLATQLDMFHNSFEKDPVRKERVRENNRQAVAEMRTHLNDVLIPDAKRAIEAGDARDDILSRLLRIQFNDAVEFDESRIVTNVMGTLVGGIETTSQAAIQTLAQLFKRPRPLAMAREIARSDTDSDDDRAQLLQLCREALRFDPINPLVVRRCAEDFVVAKGNLRRRKIRKGKTVLVCTRSAMRDGRQLELPSAFALDRPDHHYMHFGFGHHRCLGDHITAVQLPEIVRAVLRLNDPRPIGEPDKCGGPFPEHYRIAVGRTEG